MCVFMQKNTSLIDINALLKWPKNKKGKPIVHQDVGFLPNLQ